MSNATQTEAGAVISLWRYPVKSMIGEGLDAAQLRDHGFFGDRAYALLDRSDGKIATAKNPRKWPNLFAFGAAFIAPSADAAQVPSVRITLPDGTIVTSDQSDLNQTLSKVLTREVTLVATEHGQVRGVPSSVPASWSAKSEE